MKIISFGCYTINICNLKALRKCIALFPGRGTLTPRDLIFTVRATAGGSQVGDAWHHKVFQLYIGIEFLDLPATLQPYQSEVRLSESSHRFPHTHWFTRIETIAPNLIDHRYATFKLFESTHQLELIKGLTAYFSFISEQLAAETPQIHQEYLLHLSKNSNL